MSNINMSPAKSVDLEKMVEYYQKQMREEAYTYLQKRGITRETVEQYRIGFDPGKIGFYVTSSQLGDYFENRVIIPITNADNVTVDLIGRAIDLREPKYKSLLGVEDFMFNEPILNKTDDVIICGGIFDVLSLAQAHLPAVCLPMPQSFKETHAERFRGKRVFICLGNDELGRRESVRIQSMLQNLAKTALIIYLPETIRDINDFFVKIENPVDKFMQMLNHSMEETLLLPLAPDVKYITAYTEEYMKRYRHQTSGIPTGFKRLDEALFGGLGNGLYLLAGTVSSGKTMLMKQMADYIALQQVPVVYVSWDMTSFELWARSIARMIGTEPQKILNGKTEPEEIQKANKEYVQISKMLWTIECALDTPMERVISSVERIAMSVGIKPVVFIDHLNRIPLTGLQQVPTIPSAQQTLRAYILKQWTREWGGAVIAAIPTDKESEKLPEGVEASADVIMIMKSKPTEDANNGTLIDLDVVKHRNGSNAVIPMRFYDQKAKFAEVE